MKKILQDAFAARARTLERNLSTNPDAEGPPEGRIDRVVRAIDHLEGVRAGKAEAIARTQPKLEAISTPFRAGSTVARRVRSLQGKIEDAFREECLAEEEAIETIRAASPGGDDPDQPHAFLHPDGRLYIALPDGQDLECEKILVIDPGRIAGLPPRAEPR